MYERRERAREERERGGAGGECFLCCQQKHCFTDADFSMVLLDCVFMSIRVCLSTPFRMHLASPVCRDEFNLSENMCVCVCERCSEVN